MLKIKKAELPSKNRFLISLSSFENKRTFKAKTKIEKNQRA